MSSQQAGLAPSQETERINQENKNYLVHKVNPILENLMLELVTSKPDNQIGFLLKVLEKTYEERATNGDRDQLNFLKDEEQRLQLKLKGMKHKSKKVKEEEEKKEDHSDQQSDVNNSEDEDVIYQLLISSYKDEDDYEEILPQKIESKKAKGPRNSVSAEAFGQWNKKGEFIPKVVEKSDQIKQQISQRLSQAFMFSALNDKEKEIVINAMDERRVKKGEHVIDQGEEGDNLYVVESGILNCYKHFKHNDELVFLKHYKPGESFGELALLYNAPRAATIIAEEDAILWSLDRYTFTHIVKDSASKRREKYEKFLEKVKILQTMDAYEKSKLSDAFKELTFNDGEYIIKEGEEGNSFYIIEEGEAVATKRIKPEEDAQVVMEYKRVGDYFGERSLLKNEPRAANIIAKGVCRIVELDRHSFKRLMGPLKDILKRNMEIYDIYKPKE